MGAVVAMSLKELSHRLADLRVSEVGNNGLRAISHVGKKLSGPRAGVVSKKAGWVPGGKR